MRETKSFREKLILVFDNASIHKSPEVRDFLLKRGYTAITVPRYTPDFNPVEKLFALLKSRFVRSDLIPSELYRQVMTILLELKQETLQ